MKTAFTAQRDLQAAVNEIKSQLSANPLAVVYFASSDYAPEEISKAMDEAFPKAKVFGCTTAGEFVNGHSLENAIVAAALEDDIIEDIEIACVENIKDKIDLKKAFTAFEKHFGQSLLSMEIDKYVGLVLVDGLSMAEENIMDKIGAMTDVFFVGGSAGDNGAFKETFVYANGNVYKNACLLALLKVENGFSVVKTQCVEITDKAFTVTKVDSKTREIYELDGRPASAVYCDALGLTLEEVKSKFKENPFGIVIGNDPYVRSIRAIDSDKISLYCAVENGNKLNILHSLSDKIVEKTKSAFDKSILDMGGASGAVVFNCILRKMELESIDGLDKFVNAFSVPTIGFHTYGEEYLGHLNQTTTAILFK